jgi:putative restriction endonuclease
MIRPKDHIDVFGPLLPKRYSPLQPSGDGKQAVYLASVPEDLAETLIGLIGPEAYLISGRAKNADPVVAIQAINAEVEVWERHIEDTIASNSQIAETDRESLILARRGQGTFKNRVMQIEDHCRITSVNNPIHLRASHCKPWRDCITNDERLNGENGLLLTPTIDHLFDRGFISFEDSGELIVSPVAHHTSLNRMGVITDRVVNVGAFTEGQRHFLEYHRESVLLRAAQ